MITKFESLLPANINDTIYDYLIHHYGWNIITDKHFSKFSGGTDSGMILSSMKGGVSTGKDFEKLNLYAEIILDLVIKGSVVTKDFMVRNRFTNPVMKRCFWNYYHSNSCAEEHCDTTEKNHWSIVYYLNDVEGAGTRIVDGETGEDILVPSVAGNAVLFPSSYIHTGTPPSGLNHRCCLNIIFEAESYV